MMIFPFTAVFKEILCSMLLIKKKKLSYAFCLSLHFIATEKL